jgi:hypothetical protein
MAEGKRGKGEKGRVLLSSAPLLLFSSAVKWADGWVFLIPHS